MPAWMMASPTRVCISLGPDFLVSTIYGYDAMGRVTVQYSCMPSECGTYATVLGTMSSIG